MSGLMTGPMAARFQDVKCQLEALEKDKSEEKQDFEEQMKVRPVS